MYNRLLNTINTLKNTHAFMVHGLLFVFYCTRRCINIKAFNNSSTKHSEQNCWNIKIAYVRTRSCTDFEVYAFENT